MRLVPSLAAAAAALTLGAAPALAQDALTSGAPDATATLTNRDGAEAGRVEIHETAQGLLFRVDARNLPQGWHGFHIHETADCSGDFKAAGGHYAPGGQGHGFATKEGAHAGDLPNIHAGEDGVAKADMHAVGLSLDGNMAPLMDEDGSALIVHAKADSYQDSAGAGDRIACGEITMDG